MRSPQANVAAGRRIWGEPTPDGPAAEL